MADFPIKKDRRTATGTIVTGGARLLGFIVETPGSALSIEFYDDTDAATPANLVYTKGFAAFAVGDVVLFNPQGIPMGTGIHYVEATGGEVLVLYSDRG